MNSAIDFITNNKLATLAGISLASIAAYGLYFVKRPQNLPPGPCGYPYIGSSREFTSDTQVDLKRLSEKYGDIFCLWIGGNRYWKFSYIMLCYVIYYSIHYNCRYII